MSACFFCLFVYLSGCLHLCLSVCICLSVCMLVCMHVCLYVVCVKVSKCSRHVIIILHGSTQYIYIYTCVCALNTHVSLVSKYARV